VHESHAPNFNSALAHGAYGEEDAVNKFFVRLNNNFGVCPHILDLLSHEEYDRIFGYRKR
jgi:hypothetical protein